jgi:NAD(P)H-hydrate repair Nnr-like enzyme with NAD(P)H-hydrate dehydratase domain
LKNSGKNAPTVCRQTLAAARGKPLVIDADGLNLLDPEMLREAAAAPTAPTAVAVLTPHPAEAARLLKTTVSEVSCGSQARRIIVHCPP